MRKRKRFWNWKINCFILTKWYVNITLVVMVICGLMGFILTKWYVNENRMQHKRNGKVGFILTKWYVNLNK